MRVADVLVVPKLKASVKAQTKKEALRHATYRVREIEEARRRNAGNGHQHKTRAKR